MRLRLRRPGVDVGALPALRLSAGLVGPQQAPSGAGSVAPWVSGVEGRLHKLLNVDRGDVWRQLRDDRHNIAELARRRGWPDPAKLAAALIAPHEPSLSAQRTRELRRAALRTLTQGHLAQHLFFHSLHQFAIPSEAPTIFGVTDAEFRVLRRGEQSPLEIGRQRGRSPGQIERLSAAVLRERIRAGVASPALSADGARVVFEAYQQKLPLALSKGEISVASRTVTGTGAALHASQPNSARSTPRSAYNPSVSRDGRLVAFESAEGNLNFAKCYGQIRVFVRDTVAGRTREIGHRASGGGVSRSEYSAALAADGTRVAYQAARAGGESAVFVCELKTGRTQLASRAAASGARQTRLDTGKRVGAARVSILDNAFRRGADRPLVRLGRGGRIHWRWDSQQSHRVSTRSGPTSVASPTRNDGSFSARLTTPGRYVFVCSIHAPGMRMTVDVR